MAWSDNADLGSGLPDRFTLKIASARIKYPYEKNPTQAAVVLDGVRTMPDGTQEDDHLWLKPGTRFEAGDTEGTFLVHDEQSPAVFDDPNVTPKKINGNSGYGRFLASMKSAVGSFAPLIDNQAPDRAKYEIWDLLMWEGLEVDVAVETGEWTVDNGPDKGKVVQTRTPLIVGVVGSASSGGATSATAAPAASNGAVSEDQAKLLAKSSPDYLKYLETVTGQGVDPSSPMAQEAFYSSART